MVAGVAEGCESEEPAEVSWILLNYSWAVNTGYGENVVCRNHSHTGARLISCDDVDTPSEANG